MSAQDDYTDEMTDVTISAEDPIGLDDLAIEALLSGLGSDFATSLDAIPPGAEPLMFAMMDLRALGEGPAPKPSPELDFMMGAKIIPLYPPNARRRSRIKVTGAFAAAASVALGLVWTAAANQQLPDGAQGIVSKVVNNLTPFHVEPTSRHDSDHNPGQNGNPNQPGPLPNRIGGGGRPTSTPSAGTSNNPAMPRSSAPAASAHPSPDGTNGNNAGGNGPNNGNNGGANSNPTDVTATDTTVPTTDVSSTTPSTTPPVSGNGRSGQGGGSTPHPGPKVTTPAAGDKTHGGTSGGGR